VSTNRSEARARAREQREAELRRQRRREQLVRFGILGAVALVVLVVVILVFANRSQEDTAAALPAGVTEPGGGVVIGDESAPVAVDLWIDFQCPFCRAFEEDAGSTLQQLAADGDAMLVYHPLSFLGEESERAANAFGCAADAGRAGEYLTVLFENQPPEGSGGFTTEDLVAFGGDAGITGSDFEQCVEDVTYADWVANVATSQREAGVSATPTVFVDGEMLPADQLSPEGLLAAVEAATDG
jgi:protein-disulfide isomerase